jgi:bacterioferritin (cytochrome b1)
MSTEVITSLQESAGEVAHLVETYRVYRKCMKNIGAKPLASDIKGFYKGSEDQLGKLLKRIIFYEQTPTFSVGKITGSDSIGVVLGNCMQRVTYLLSVLYKNRRAAWDAKADYTADIYEHAVLEFEGQLVKIRREKKLLAELGEKGYMGAQVSQ